MPAAPRPTIRQQAALLEALRGGTPAGHDVPATLDALLRRYECGGWLHARRSAPGAAPLPEPWQAAAARAHRKTLLDSLAALGVFREVGERFAALGIPLILLKGAAYLAGLHADPGERALTDIDLLVRPRNAARAGTCLAEAGFVVLQTDDSPHVAEYRRFEMARPGPAPCRVEIHWHLGTGGRMRFDQEALWERALPATLEGVDCRVLDPTDGLLYHVGHAAEHYFGPTLKWALDLRAMLERGQFDADRIVAGARASGLRIALHLALLQVESLFPGSAPADLQARIAPTAARRAILGRLRTAEPIEFLPWSTGDPRRSLLRPLLCDGPGDAAGVILAVLRRPWIRRHGPPPERPWEAAPGGGGAPEGVPTVD